MALNKATKCKTSRGQFGDNEGEVTGKQELVCYLATIQVDPPNPKEFLQNKRANSWYDLSSEVCEEGV